MLSLASAASAFSLAPNRAALPSLGAPLLRGTAVRMADGEKPMKSANESPLSAVTDKLSTVPWNDLLLGFVTVDCAGRLSNSVPAWSKSSLGYAPARLLRLLTGLPAGPLGTQPPPRVLELAASNAAHLFAFDHPGVPALFGPDPNYIGTALVSPYQG